MPGWAELPSAILGKGITAHAQRTGRKPAEGRTAVLRDWPFGPAVPRITPGTRGTGLACALGLAEGTCWGEARLLSARAIFEAADCVAQSSGSKGKKCTACFLRTKRVGGNRRQCNA